MSSDSAFVHMARMVRHDDPDMLDVCLVTLALNGHIGWRKGRFMGQHGIYNVIVKETRLGEAARFRDDIWPLIKRFGVDTIGCQNLRYFCEVK